MSMKSGPNLSNPMSHNLTPGGMTLKESKRVQILKTAADLTSGDRDKAYGTPFNNLSIYTNLVRAYMGGRDINTLDAVDGSILMVLAKVSRISFNKNHADNYVDGAAYMAIAGECAELLEMKNLGIKTWHDGSQFLEGFGPAGPSGGSV
jgi:hypothetical protein